MSKVAWAAWAAKNIAVVVCFTVLAIHFGKWWIILFAYFFVSTLETKSETHRQIKGKKGGG